MTAIWQRVLFFLTVVKKLGISQLRKKTMFHKNYENDSINFEMCAVMLLMILLLLCCIEEGYDGLESSTVPEMQRSDLAPVILQMKALGVSNIVRFNFLSVNWKAFRIPHSVLCEIYSDMMNYVKLWRLRDRYFNIFIIFQPPPAQNMIRGLELLYALQGVLLC